MVLTRNSSSVMVMVSEVVSPGSTPEGTLPSVTMSVSSSRSSSWLVWIPKLAQVAPAAISRG